MTSRTTAAATAIRTTTSASRGAVLGPDHPNPFNPVTMIHFELQEAAAVRITVHDALGREIIRLVDGGMPAGAHRPTWDN